MFSSTFSGTLPAEWSVLKALASLGLSSNSLSGTLPAQWSEMKALTSLGMSSSSLSGTLPAQWSEMTALASLSMGFPGLSGSLPAQWSALQALAFLDMSETNLSGTLPAQWSTLKDLGTLAISSNRLSGTLPAQWSALRALIFLFTEDNSLSGTLPAEWSALEALNSLSMSNNSLSGTLPAQWSALKALNYLDFLLNGLSGTLPVEWSALKALTQMRMSANSLSGTLPAQWSALNALGDLVMVNNSFSGTLPAQWSTMTTLASLELSSNSLSGTLPAQWSALKALGTLAVLDNNLSGLVPAAWRNLGASLSLSCRVLDAAVMDSWEPVWFNIDSLTVKYVNGTMPTGLSKLASLRYLNMTGSWLYGTLPLWVNKLFLRSLDLSHNQFTGTVPVTWAESAILESVALSNNLLNGPLPGEWRTLATLTSLDLSSNQLTGTLPQEWSKIISLDSFGLEPSLAILKVANNNLHGPIPSSWLTNSTWWDTFVYIDVSSNQLTGMVPHLPSNIQLFNASNNSFTGTLPPIPPSLVYLHVAHNSLSGTIPDITNNSKLAFADISQNQFSALPAVFQAPKAIFLNASGNRLQGFLPSHGYNHSLVYCDLSRNQLFGHVPDSWHNHMWSYLALDNNQLSGGLPVWSGHAEVLLLQHNHLTGCVLPDVSQLRSTKVLSISSQNISCLTANWSTTLTNLSLLDVSGTSARLVPLTWMGKNAFAKEQTVLRLGKMWTSSAQHSRKWRRSVCIRKDLNDKLSRSLNYTALPPGIQQQIQDQINEGLAELATTLRSLNVTSIKFDIGPLQLRLDDKLPNVTRDDICGNDLARPILIIQYSLLCSAIIAMVVVYWVQCRWHLLSKCHNRRGTSWFALDRQRRYAAHTWLVLSIMRSGKFLGSLLLYWFDVVSDIVLIAQVWQFSRAWPGYVLLGILLVHYAVALVLLAWRAQITTLNKILSVVFGMPFVPILDTAMFVFLIGKRCLPTQQNSFFASAVMLQWEAMFEMREVLEVFIEAIPTSVFQSTIFLLGNRPSLGWFLDTRLYIVSAVASSAQILRMVATILWESAHDDVAPWTTMWNKVSLKSNNQPTSRLQLATNTTGSTSGQPSSDGKNNPSAHGIQQGLEQL